MKNKKNTSFFGIGCFFFIPKRKPPFKLTAKSFADDIKSFLSSIAAVSNINISDIDSEDEEQIEVLSPIGNFSDEPSFPPFTSRLDISFQVYIPLRVQKELIKDISQPEIDSEYFHVHIMPGYSAPVTFVELISTSKPSNPSDAIVVVREYLRKYAPKENTFVEFEILGPSPFHANFYLFPKDNKKKYKDKDMFFAERIERRGYDNILISYNDTYFDSHLEAKEAFFFNATEELSLYYAIQLNELKELKFWFEIEEEVDNIIEDKSTKFIKRIYHALRRGAHIKRLQALITELESQKVFKECSINQEYRDIYVKHEVNLFQSLLDEAIKDKQLYPIKPIMELASFLEQRRGRTMEMFIVFISALLGGIAGAVVTLYFINN